MIAAHDFRASVPLRLSILSAGISLTLIAYGHGGDANLVHACVNAASGAVKLVAPDAECEKNWQAIDWNIQGPPGPVDPVLLGRIGAIENQLSSIQRELAAITNQLTPPELSIADIAVQESDATLTLSLSKPYGNPVQVNYSTQDGTAFAPRDYGASAGTVEFVPGEVTKTITIAVSADNTPELDETFLVVLSGVSNATLVKDVATVTLINNDFPTLQITGLIPYYLTGFTANDNSYGHPIVEGEFRQIAVTSFPPAEFPFSVDYALVGNRATEGVDFVAEAGTISFAPGEIIHHVSVSVLDDNIPEGDEDFELILSNPVDAILSPTESRKRLSIVHSDLSIAVGDVTVTEGAGSPTIATVEVGISSPVDAPVLLFPQWIEGTGTALLDEDFILVGLSGGRNLNCRDPLQTTLFFCDSRATFGLRIEIPPGQSSTLHDLAFIKDDNVTEGTEFFEVTTVNYSPAQSPGNPVGTITILDND